MNYIKHIIVSKTCTPPDWIDAVGNTCEDYVNKKYCNIDGLYGEGWFLENGTFDNWRSNGYSAWSCNNCGCIAGMTK